MLTTINGATQIRPGTVPLSALVANYQIPTPNLADGLNFLKKDGSVILTGPLNFGGNAGTNAATPTNANDIATKSYVDSKVNGLSIHPSVRFVVASNIDISGPSSSTFDGGTAVVGDRLFLIGQTTASQNGPWVFNGLTFALSRPSDWASGSIQGEGAYWITDPDGTTYKNSKFFTANTSSITVDTTAVTFIQDSSSASYTGINGVSVSGSTISLNYQTGGGLSIAGNSAIVLPDTSRGIQTSGLGVGIVDAPSPGAIVLSGSNNKFSWATISGDVSLSTTGVATVNNTSGSGFVKYGNLIANEVPGGALNGTNKAFTIANTPVVGTVRLYYNGGRLTPGTGNDYTISGKILTLAFAPTSSDDLLVDYQT